MSSLCKGSRARLRSSAAASLARPSTCGRWRRKRPTRSADQRAWGEGAWRPECLPFTFPGSASALLLQQRLARSQYAFLTFFSWTTSETTCVKCDFRFSRVPPIFPRKSLETIVFSEYCGVSRAPAVLAKNHPWYSEKLPTFPADRKIPAK